MATVSSRFRSKKMERAVGFEPTMIGFADQRLKPTWRCSHLDFGFWIEDKSEIRNLKSKIDLRTTGFEPAIFNLKG